MKLYILTDISLMNDKKKIHVGALQEDSTNIYSAKLL